MKNKEYKIRDEYFKKIKRWFAWNYFIECVAIAMLILSIIHLLFRITWIYENWESFAVFGIVINIPLTILFLILLQIRKSLIYKIVISDNFTLLYTYNETILSIYSLKETWQQKENSDWYLQSFLSSRNGIGTIYKGKLDGYILNIDGKEYYFVPKLFESEMINFLKVS